MVEHQPGRPSEDEFIGAALRFLEDNYQAEPVCVSTGYYVNVQYVYPGKDADKDILRRECFAEGLPGQRESMREFALRQLASYQKQRKG